MFWFKPILPGFFQNMAVKKEPPAFSCKTALFYIYNILFYVLFVFSFAAVLFFLIPLWHHVVYHTFGTGFSPSFSSGTFRASSSSTRFK